MQRGQRSSVRTSRSAELPRVQREMEDGQFKRRQAERRVNMLQISTRNSTDEYVEGEVDIVDDMSRLHTALENEKKGKKESRGKDSVFRRKVET